MASPARIIARLGLVIGACLVTAGYSTCIFVGTSGTNDDGVPGIGQGFQTSLVLRNTNGQVAISFLMGEPIRFDLEIENLGGQNAILQFPDSQIYDFYVFDSATNRVRWRWSAGMAFEQVATQLTFTPYSSKSYSVVWNGILADGTQLPAGNYRARGVIVADNFLTDPFLTSDLGSELVNFTVR